MQLLRIIGKKGQGDQILGMQVPYVIIVSLVLVVTSIFLFMGFRNYQNTILGPTQLTQNIIYSNLLLASPECFAFHDAVTGRVYPFEIDLRKFTDSRLKHCFQPTDRGTIPADSFLRENVPTQKGPAYSVQVTLIVDDEETKQLNSIPIHSRSATRALSTPVLVRDGERIYPATVKTQVWFSG